MFKHDPGRRDVVGSTNVMIYLGQFLRHVVQLILTQSQGLLGLHGEAVHDLDVMVQVPDAFLVTGQLGSEAVEVSLHLTDGIEGVIVINGEGLDVVLQGFYF